MSILHTLLDPIPIPKMVRIRQKFDAAKMDQIVEVLREQLKQPGAIDTVKPGQRVAVAVGSRGVANIAAFTRETVRAIKEAGAEPFIVPCMGSHGGATAEGQTEVLHHLGVSEETVGAPILSSMEVVKID
ncbi:MAG: hypothetical protein K0Q59_2442, partial [Paenibacillus sp.]|nr:hypothetical protein [Paenibacillus sp.]